ncbi:MAG TPA: Bax inhibitor-1/YccA family protein, partial [Bacillales bacterium]|nr:Bax inhibitor-1/YccA family protein [Bacillales bacterium]
IVYLIDFILNIFGANVPYLHGSGWIGVGISLFIVVVAALNLVLDFDFIERGVQSGAPKYMEWYGAFGLTVTLIWLYIETLRLISKLRN